MSEIRILVAEDNQINQLVVTRMLERMSYTADVVSNGQQAVEASRDTQYDIILMDVTMPVMGGKEATQIIRREESPSHRAQIIALTAHVLDSDRFKCLEAGMDDYISKPFVFETLRSKMAAAAESIAATHDTVIPSSMGD